MKKIFITGVCGFIGKALANKLVEIGYEVDGVDSLVIGTKEDLHPDIGFQNMFCDSQFYLEHMEDIYDIFIHLASYKIPLKKSDIAKFLIANTEGTKNVVEHAMNCNARLIFASTSDIYGKQTEFKETSDSILGPTNISRWSYAISKLWSEHLIHATEGLKFNIIRYFNVYGPGQSLKKVSATPMAIFTEQAFKKEPITVHGDGSQMRCFSYIDDVIDGTVRVIESNYDREIFNIGDPDGEISILDLGRLVWEMINPDDALIINMGMDPVDNKMEYEDIKRRVPGIGKARKMLGWTPKVVLIEGLKKTIEWQRTID